MNSPPTDIPTPRTEAAIVEVLCAEADDLTTYLKYVEVEDMAKLERENVKLKGDLMEAAGCEAGLRTQLMLFKDERDRLKAENSKAKEQIEDLLVNLQIEKEKNSEAEEFVLVKSKHLELLRENEQLKAALGDANKLIESACNEATEFCRQKDELKAEVERLKQRPDIGPDPLKANGEERKRLHDETRDRLRKACSIQQKEVPDQTALVWRIDLSRFDQDLILTEARLNNSRDQISLLEKQVLEMREALQGSIKSVRTMILGSQFTQEGSPLWKWEQALSSTPSSISAKWVRREVLEKCAEAISFVRETHNWKSVLLDEALTLARAELNKNIKHE